VGTKAVNALSNYFRVESVREDKQKAAEFSAGNLVLEEDIIQQSEREQKLPLFLTKLYLKITNSEMSM
jgi:DNA gyrase/topoisomerase IV subunit B